MTIRIQLKDSAQLEQSELGQPQKIESSYSSTELNELADIAHQCSAGAAELLMKYYQRDGLEIIAKQDCSPVTEADHASCSFLRQQLVAATSLPVVSEEHIPPFEQRRNWSQYWLVDPLDGTQNFINRDDEFSINIALVDNGVPVVGVIAVPAQKITYVAQLGCGASKHTPSGSKKIANSLGGDLRKIVDSKLPQENGRRLSLDFIKHNSLSPDSVFRIGSAYKLGLLAEGQFDLALRYDPMWEWDIAAGDCILGEANCYVLDLATNQSISYNSTTSLKLSCGYIAMRQNLGCKAT